MDRMKQIYEKKGYSKSWIEQRERGANVGGDYAVLANEIYKSGFGFIAKEYKDIKGLHESQNLRDSMTNVELELTNLGSAAAVELHQNNDSQGMRKLKGNMQKAGKVLNKSKTELEFELNRPVVTSKTI